MNKRFIELGECVQKLNNIAAKYNISKQILFSEWLKCISDDCSLTAALLAVEVACATIRENKQSDYINVVNAAQQVLARLDGVDLNAPTEDL